MLQGVKHPRVEILGRNCQRSLAPKLKAMGNGWRVEITSRRYRYCQIPSWERWRALGELKSKSGGEEGGWVTSEVVGDGFSENWRMREFRVW